MKVNKSFIDVNSVVFKEMQKKLENLEDNGKSIDVEKFVDMYIEAKAKVS